jgi:hypothetical protein
MSSAREVQASGQNLERGNQMKTKQLRSASEVWAERVWAISPTAVSMGAQNQSRVNAIDKEVGEEIRNTASWLTEGC